MIDADELSRLAAAATKPDPQVGFDGKLLLWCGEPDERGITTIFYGDGDGCAEVYGNLGLGVDGLAVARFLAAMGNDGPAILLALKALRAVNAAARAYRDSMCYIPPSDEAKALDAALAAVPA